MERIFKKISILDYNKFVQIAKKLCHWSEDVWSNKKSGRTKLTELEFDILSQLADEIDLYTFQDGEYIKQ